MKSSDCLVTSRKRPYDTMGVESVDEMVATFDREFHAGHVDAAFAAVRGCGTFPCDFVVRCVISILVDAGAPISFLERLEKEECEISRDMATALLREHFALDQDTPRCRIRSSETLVFFLQRYDAVRDRSCFHANLLANARPFYSRALVRPSVFLAIEKACDYTCWWPDADAFVADDWDPGQKAYKLLVGEVDVTGSPYKCYEDANTVTIEGLDRLANYMQARDSGHRWLRQWCCRVNTPFVNRWIIGYIEQHGRRFVTSDWLADANARWCANRADQAYVWLIADAIKDCLLGRTANPHSKN